MSARTVKAAPVPAPANDADAKARPGPPVDSWVRLVEWIRDNKVKLNKSEREKPSLHGTSLDFVAKLLTDSCGFDDWRGHEFSEEWFELIRHGQKALTIRAARTQIVEWKREWEEDSGETTPYDLRDELEEYFS